MQTITIIGNCITPARAIPILSREGQIDEIIILDPGSGYIDIPIIRISPPPRPKKQKFNNNKVIVAKATAKLEYKISDNIEILQKGNGYIYDQLPNITISKPDTYMDWITPEKLNYDSTNAHFEIERITSNPIYIPKSNNDINNNILSQNVIKLFKKDITSLLPNTIRPKYINNTYTLDDILPQSSLSISSSSLFQNKKNYYRAIDPIFGPISSM